MIVLPFFGSQVNRFDYASLLQPEKETKMDDSDSRKTPFELENKHIFTFCAGGIMLVVGSSKIREFLKEGGSTDDEIDNFLCTHTGIAK